MLTPDQTALISLLSRTIHQKDFPELFGKSGKSQDGNHELLPRYQAVKASFNFFQWTWNRLFSRELKKAMEFKDAVRHPGSPSFELSKRQALDRANSWKIPAQAGRSKVPGGMLGVQRNRQRAQVVKPLYMGDAFQVCEDQATYAVSEKSAQPAPSSEDHLEYETTGWRH